MKTLLVAASLVLAASTAAYAAEMPKQVQGTWCIVKYDPAHMVSTYRRGPCADKYKNMTITASGYRDHGPPVICTAATVEPSAKIGWDIKFECLYNKQRDRGHASFLVYPMTGGRLGMAQVTP